MRASFQIATILGIPIRIHVTFLFIIALFAWFFGAVTVNLWGFPVGYGNLALSTGWKYALGTLASIVLFSCVLAHELGHSYVTQRYGIRIREITLFIFGGISQSEEIPREPRKELSIALVGPAISLALGGVFWLLFLGSTLLGSSLVAQILLVTFGTLAFYNIILALFNLIPAFPIDGGRVLRALLATRLEYSNATHVASLVGRGFAIGMAVFGILVLNLWLVFIAVFIYLGASQEENEMRLTKSLEGVTAQEIMHKDFSLVSPEMTLRDFITYAKERQSAEFPVVSQDRVVGMVTLDDLKKAERGSLEQTLVRDVMEERIPVVSPNEDAILSLRKLSQGHTNQMLVGSTDNVQGVLSRNDFVRFIQMQERLRS